MTKNKTQETHLYKLEPFWSDCFHLSEARFICLMASEQSHSKASSAKAFQDKD